MKLEMDKKYSKSFVFPDLFAWADFVEILELRVVYASNGPVMKITTNGRSAKIIDKLVDKCSGMSVDNETKGKWSETSL